MCFDVEYRREIRCPQGEIAEAVRDESYFQPEAVLFGRKKKKQTSERWEDECRKLYITADVNAN